MSGKLKKKTSYKKNIPTCQPQRLTTNIMEWDKFSTVYYLPSGTSSISEDIFFLNSCSKLHTVCSTSGHMLYWFVLVLISLRSQHLLTPVMKPVHRQNKPHCQGETGLHWGFVIRKGSLCFRWGWSKGTKSPLVSSSLVLQLKARCHGLQSYLL